MPVFIRRLLALSYDLFLLLCLWLIVTTVVVLCMKGQAVPAGALWYQGLLLLVAHAFFIGFWCWGRGQTLGLKAWRLQLVSLEHAHADRQSPPTALQGGLYFWMGVFSVGLLGLGWWWCLVNRERLTWYEWCSRTKLVLRS